jgi:hypothetical protein
VSGANLVSESNAGQPGHSAQKRWPSAEVWSCLDWSNPDTVTDFFLGVDEGVAPEIFRPSHARPERLCNAGVCL